MNRRSRTTRRRPDNTDTNDTSDSSLEGVPQMWHRWYARHGAVWRTTVQRRSTGEAGVVPPASSVLLGHHTTASSTSTTNNNNDDDDDEPSSPRSHDNDDTTDNTGVSDERKDDVHPSSSSSEEMEWNDQSFLLDPDDDPSFSLPSSSSRTKNVRRDDMGNAVSGAASTAASVIIDLVDDDDSDDHDIEFIASSGEADEFLEDDDDDNDSDDDDHEDDNDCSDDDFGMKALVDRTNQLVILSSSSSEDESDYSTKRAVDRIARRTDRRKINKDNRRPSKTTTAKTTAKRARTDFRKHREAMALSYLKKFDNSVFGGRLTGTGDTPLVTVAWTNKLRTTAGQARLSKRNRYATSSTSIGFDRVGHIELNPKVLDNPDRLQATLMHELCHCAAWIVDGNTKPPHGPHFQTWANRAMRAMPNIAVTTTHDYEISYKYAWGCIVCRQVYQRQSRSIDIVKKVCGKCRGRLQEIHVPTDPLAPHVPRRTSTAPLSAYHQFVRDQSGAVRARLLRDASTASSGRTVTQPQVLKECARLWKIHKVQQQQTKKSPG